MWRHLAVGKSIRSGYNGGVNQCNEVRSITPNETAWSPVASTLPVGELARRARLLRESLSSCHICPHACAVNRLIGEKGRCRVGSKLPVASVCDHHGEEPALAGKHGAGTIFAAGCNLRCCYCQNHQISQQDPAAFRTYTSEELAEAMLDLQRRGCHNLDWVSPSHVVPQLVEGLAIAVAHGCRLPVVYNSNGYDSLDTLALLDGVVDIYLPDLKYGGEEPAQRLSSAPGYPDIAIAAIREMYRQVGDLELDDASIARRGLIVRHLVLPHNLAGTRTALRRLAEEVSPTVTVSLMAQYYPTARAADIPELSRTITAAEYDEALDAFADAGLENGWAQELLDAPDTYRPDFTENHPFH